MKENDNINSSNSNKENLDKLNEAIEETKTELNENPDGIVKFTPLIGWLAFFLVMGLMLISTLIMGFLAYPLAEQGISNGGQGKLLVFLSLLITDIIIFSVIYGLIKTLRFHYKKVLGLKLIKEVKIYILAILGILVLNVLLTLLWSLVSQIDPSIVKEYEDMTTSHFMAKSVLEFILLVIFVSIGAGILEEALFRGIILNSFLKSYPPVLAIVLSSLLFGVMHMNIVQGISGFVLGLYLAILTYKTKSIYPAMAAHISNNLFSLILTHTL